MKKIERRFGPGIACAFLAITTLIAPPGGASSAANPDAMRLLEASGFDAMLRLDATLDAALIGDAPESMPPELRADLAGVLDQSLAYSEMRRAMAEKIASRLDAAAIDRSLRWWASNSGTAISAARLDAFRDSLQRQAGPGDGAGFASISRDTRECLRMSVNFRRECDVAALVLKPSDVTVPEFASPSKADATAYSAYLNTPGAAEAVRILGDAYVQTRSGKLTGAQHLVTAAVERFARARIGKEAEATLQRVVALVDAERNLDQAQVILHLLRAVEPRDPRIPVELTRVAIKQAPLVRGRNVPGAPPAIAPEYLEDAQSWMDLAIALDPGRADTLVLAGHVAYLKCQYPRSIALLEQAARIGTSNPWLRLNLSDALWAQGRDQNLDHALLDRAARELETAIANGLPAQMQWQANHSLAHIYEDMRDVARGRAQYQRLISVSEGYEKADAWNDYAEFLFTTADDLDGAIGAARQATRVGGFGVGHEMLIESLAVKAGRLYLAGKRDAAAKLVEEARDADRNLTQNYWILARTPLKLPAVVALLESGLISDLSDSDGGRVLLFASAFADAADMERLIKWRANPNYLDPDNGTPLQMAIRAGNPAAVRVLLAHGADVSTRDYAGKLPVELAETSSRNSAARGAEVLTLLRAATRNNPAATPVGAPLKPGYVYQALKQISGGRWGSSLDVGTQLVFVSFGRYTDDSLVALNFKNPNNREVLMDVALEKAQLVSWQEWFKEIGPEPAPGK